jgi:iron complex transport system substrate-binding protein
MRIVSLLGSATEIVFELGLQAHLVAISHECDHPPEALELPRVSRPRFDPAGLTSGEIDAAVRSSMEEFGSVYEVDVEALRRLKPDLVLTQAVCEVCAVPTGSVEEAVAGLAGHVRVASLDAHTVEGIFATLHQVADAAGAPRRGDEAASRLQARLDQVAAAVAGEPAPRVLLLEWLDPPFAPGHWVPEMVELAGGRNLLGDPGLRSVQVSPEEVAGLDPDYLLIEPCGFDLDRAAEDADRHREWLDSIGGRAISDGRAWLLHSAWFSRSGPRIVEGVEALAAILHPGAVPDLSFEGRARAWPG